MVYWFISILTGLALGFGSFYYQKLFLGVALALLSGLQLFVGLTIFLGRVSAREVRPTDASSGYVSDMLNLYRVMFELLPEGAQLGLCLLPVALVVGRALTWMHYTAFPDAALPLTDAERQHNTLSKFSLKRPPR